MEHDQRFEPPPASGHVTRWMQLIEKQPKRDDYFPIPSSLKPL
jgi:hypothetical protein